MTESWSAANAWCARLCDCMDITKDKIFDDTICHNLNFNFMCKDSSASSLSLSLSLSFSHTFIIFKLVGNID
jgi:hypothetical protein